nr:hypothetical protein [Tanacetum cinerariifolium]
MIPEPGDANREVTVTETFHVQIDDEVFDKELKQIEADDQAIQTILLDLPEDIYAVVDSCETAQEIWFTSNKGESIESYYHRFLKLMNDLKRNKHFPEKIVSNLKFLNNLQPEWSRHVTIVHKTKDLHTANYTQLYDFLKYNQKEVDELKAERLAKTQDPVALMENSNNPYAFPAPQQDQSSFNQNYLEQPMLNFKDITDPTTVINMTLALMAKAFKLNYSTPTNNNHRISSNPRNRQIAQSGMNMGQDRQMQMVGGNGGNQFRQYVGQNAGNLAGNQNGLVGVQGNGNQNQIRNGNLVAARAEGNAAGQNGNQIRCYNYRGVGHYARNCTVRPRRKDAAYLKTQLLIAQKEEAGIQLQAKEGVGHYARNCTVRPRRKDAAYLKTQLLIAQKEEAGIQLQAKEYDLMAAAADLEEIKENDNDVISEDTSVKQGGEKVEQHHVNFEETRTLYDSLYQNLAVEVEKVNFVNLKLKETNADLTTETMSSKKINALHLSIGKQIMTLNEQISYLNNQLSKEKSAVSFLLEEKKKVKSYCKTYEDELLDKQIQLEKKIKELNNILVKTSQSIQTIHMLSPKPDSFYHTEQKMALAYQNPFYLKQAQKKQQSLYDGKVLLKKHDPPVVHDSEETLQLAQKSHEKMKQLNKEIKPANYTKINHLSGVFIPQTAKSHEEMTIETHNWSSSAHQELHKIVRVEIFPIVNQVDARVQNYEIQFLKEETKFVGDFKSLANEADASLAKHKALELEIKRLLKAVVSQDIMNIVQKESVVDTSDL